jgi:uncharacterized membrane protein YqjE
MNKERIIAICFIIGVLIGLASVVLMFLMVLFEKYFDENKYIEMLLIVGVSLMLISPHFIIYKANNENSQNTGFSYNNFRGYFLLFLGLVSVAMYIWLKVYVMK